MKYRINFEMHETKASVERFLLELVQDGPFTATDISQVADGVWAFDLSLKRPELRLGFTKVVELQALLARSADVISVTRLQGMRLAAAS